MRAVIAALLLLAALSGAAVVFSRDPRRQIYSIAVNGLVLALLFFALAAPDVALSEVAVGSALTPLLFLVALAVIASDKARR